MPLKTCLTLVVLVCHFLCFNLAASAQPTLTLQTGVKQRIDGWGIFPSYHHRVEWGDDWHIEGRTSVQEALYRDLGVNFIRVKLTPFHYDAGAPDRLNHANIQSLINHLRIAENYGITRYMMSIWSPPASMKTPAAFEGHVWIDRTTGQIVPWREDIEQIADRTVTALRPDAEAAFIEYIVNALKYLQSQGLALPEWFSFQNEPRHSPWYDGCVYPWDQYHRVAIALRAELDRQGLSAVKLTGAENNDYGNPDWGCPILWNGYYALARDASGQPNALARALSAVSVHSYDEGGYLGNTDPAFLDRYVTTFKSTAQRLVQEFNYPIMMTEFSIDYAHSMSNMEVLLVIARHFNREMMVIPTNYWFWWAGWNRTDSTFPGSQTLMFGDGPTKSKTYHFFSTLWKRVPPGSHVKGLTSSDSSWRVDNAHAIDASAFETANSHVVVLTNVHDGARSVRLQGLTRGTSARLYRTTATEDMALIGQPALSGGALTVNLPAKSIVIVETAGGGGATPPPPPAGSVDKITSINAPASVPAGTGSLAIAINATTAGPDRTFWAGLYDANWTLRGTVGGSIIPGANSAVISYAGLGTGPVKIQVHLRDATWAQVDTTVVERPLGSTGPVDKITSLGLPSSVPARAGSVAITINATTAASGRTYWAGVYDGGWTLRGTAGGQIFNGTNSAIIPYDGLVYGPVRVVVNLRDPAYVQVDTTSTQTTLGPPNFVLNPGFENGSASWNIYGAAGLTSTSRRSGAAALEVRGGSSSNGFEQRLTGLQPGTSYTVRLWMRASVAGPTFFVGVDQTGAAAVTRSFAPGTSFAEQAFTFTVGPSSTTALLWGWRGAGGADVQIDDITVIRN